jgi:hypothetical protein
MNPHTKENTDKAKALKKLMRQWLTTQETEKKAAVLLAKNPELKRKRKARSKSRQAATR